MIEKLISDSIAFLCSFQATDKSKRAQDKARWIRALGFRLSGMKREFTDTITATMAVDGVTLFVNNNYALTKPKIDVLFILIHEGLHVWFNHPIRLRDCMPYQRELMHKAADYAVNLTAQQAGCPFPVPSYALLNPQYVDASGNCLNVERILYEMLKEQVQEQQGQDNADTSDDNQQPAESNSANDSTDAGGDDNANTSNESDSGDAEAGNDNDTGDNGGQAGDADSISQDAGGNSAPGTDPNGSTPDQCGDLLPAPSDADLQEMGRQSLAAAQLSKGAGDGSLPDGMLQAIGEALADADVDWLDQLRDRFATTVDQSDYSHERLNVPVLVAAHQVEPSLWQEAIGRVAIVGDESGSMSNEALNVIAKQTAAIVSEWNPTEVLIVRHTSKVVYTERLQQGQEPTPRKNALQVARGLIQCWITASPKGAR